MKNKEEVRMILQDPNNISRFEVYNNLFIIHFKNGSIMEIEPTGSGEHLDYYMKSQSTKKEG